MKLRLKYSLKSLLVLTTIAVLALGYPLYRRHKIRTLCAELRAHGDVFATPSEWRDYFWQRPPVVGLIAYENKTEVLVTTAMHPTRKRLETRITSDRAIIDKLKSLDMVRYEGDLMAK
jgi:hypothetical protein